MNMNIDQVTAGNTIFIAANIFIYHFTAQSPACSALLRRCQDDVIIGCTSVGCVAEMLHRLMIAEAVQKGYITIRNAVRALKEKQDIVKKLDRYLQTPTRLIEMKIKILPTTSEIVLCSKAIRKRYGLLTNDSLIVTTIKKHRLKLLAVDKDFENIPGIQLYKPADL